MSDGVLQLSDIRKTFVQGENRLNVLNGINFSLQAGQLCALVGPSGSGKTTMLQICGLLEKADSGKVILEGRDVSAADDALRTDLRRRYIGFVYQYHHLLPDFSALENIVLPQMVAGVSEAAAAKRAQDLLHQVGLTARAQHRPSQLSGGEQQRVAIARALANNPRLLIADEPTGNLDPSTAAHVFSIFQSLCRQQGLAVLMATHNLDLAAKMDQTFQMR